MVRRQARSSAVIKALADVRRQATLEGYRYQHVQAIIAAAPGRGSRRRTWNSRMRDWKPAVWRPEVMKTQGEFALPIPPLGPHIANCCMRDWRKADERAGVKCVPRKVEAMKLWSEALLKAFERAGGIYSDRARSPSPGPIHPTCRRRISARLFPRDPIGRAPIREDHPPARRPAAGRDRLFYVAPHSTRLRGRYCGSARHQTALQGSADLPLPAGGLVSAAFALFS